MTRNRNPLKGSNFSFLFFAGSPSVILYFLVGIRYVLMLHCYYLLFMIFFICLFLYCVQVSKYTYILIFESMHNYFDCHHSYSHSLEITFVPMFPRISFERDKLCL